MALEDRLRNRFDALYHRWRGDDPRRARAPEPKMLDADPVNETLDYLLEGARAALEQGHSFAPFGAATRHDGERTHLRLELEGAALTAQDAIGLLARALKQDGFALAAAGIAYDGEIRTAQGSVRAVCMHIETPQEALEAFVPYVRDPQRGLMLLKPVAAPIPSVIFAR